MGRGKGQCGHASKATRAAGFQLQAVAFSASLADTLIETHTTDASGFPVRNYLVRLPDALADELPHLKLKTGAKVWPVPMPRDRDAAVLYGHIFRLLWVEGKTLTIPELTEALRATGEPELSSLAETTLRQEIPEMAYQLRLPAAVYDGGQLASRATDEAPAEEEDQRGIRRPRGRDEVMTVCLSLDGRKGSMIESGESLRACKEWVENHQKDRHPLAGIEHPELTPGRRRLLSVYLAELGRHKGDARTAEQLAEALTSTGVNMSDWLGAEHSNSGREINDRDIRRIRQWLVAELKIPVVSSSKGSWLAESPEDLEAGAQRFDDRAASVTEHIFFLGEAAQFVWPRTAAEKTAQKEALTVSSLRELTPRGPSSHYLQAQNKSKAAQEANKARKRDEKQQATMNHRAEASKRAAQLNDEHGIRTRLLGAENLRGQDRHVLYDKHTNAIIDEWLAAEQYAGGGKAPKTNYAWAPGQQLVSLDGGKVQVPRADYLAAQSA